MTAGSAGSSVHGLTANRGFTCTAIRVRVPDIGAVDLAMRVRPGLRRERRRSLPPVPETPARGGAVRSGRVPRLRRGPLARRPPGDRQREVPVVYRRAGLLAGPSLDSRMDAVAGAAGRRLWRMRSSERGPVRTTGPGCRRNPTNPERVRNERVYSRSTGRSASATGPRRSGSVARLWDLLQYGIDIDSDECEPGVLAMMLEGGTPSRPAVLDFDKLLHSLGPHVVEPAVLGTEYEGEDGELVVARSDAESAETLSRHRLEPIDILLRDVTPEDRAKLADKLRALQAQ